MNKIEQMIAELCPNGVEFKKLGEVCLFEYGKPLKGMERNGGKYPVMGSNGIVGYHDEYLVEAPCIVVGRKSSAGAINWVDANCYPIDTTFYIQLKTNEINLKFLYYSLVNIGLDPEIQGGGVPGLNRNDAYLKKIPLPPLPIQHEIVNILDKFTQLEAELEARKKQYEYYRSKLLTNDKWEMKPLGEVGYYSYTRIDAEELNEENYVGVDNLLQNKQGKTNSSYVPEKGKLCKFEKGDILVGNIRPYLKKIWKSDRTGGTNGDVLVVRIKEREKIISEFLYYLLSSDDFFNYDTQYSKGTKMPRGDKSAVMKFKIPIPPLSEQNRIVAILDKFDKLVNDISEGLPAEINMRRQQYEYYRNKLLTFENND